MLSWKQMTFGVVPLVLVVAGFFACTSPDRPYGVEASSGAGQGGSGGTMGGELCSDSQACQSGVCLDGVCCDGPCAGPCMACTAALTGLAEGQCGPVLGGTDPHSDCDVEGATSCGRNGSCDGQGACSFYPMGTECAAQTCTGSTKTFAKTCDGAGNCQDSGMQACMMPCMGIVCGEDCASDASCAAGEYCDIMTGDCTPKRPLGATCQPGKANECISGFCSDGVCCNSACTGACQACTMALSGGINGTCTPAPNGTDPDGECMAQGTASCGHDGACNGAGACRFHLSGTVCVPGSCAGGIQSNPDICNGMGTCVDSGTIDCGAFPCAGPVCDMSCMTDMQCGSGYYCDAGSCISQNTNGVSCSSPNQCLSGRCADGVCCNDACGMPCMACTNAKKGGGANGECGPIASGTDPDNECNEDSPASCGNDGTCNGGGACRLYGPGTVCDGGSCVGNTQNNPDHCNGSGQCIEGGTMSCVPYLCDNIVCKTGCTSSADCVSGYICINGACVSLKPDGDPCSSGSECQSAFCVEGVCCNTSCDGQCESCLAMYTHTSPDGTCAPMECEDPDNECSGGTCYNGNCWPLCP